MRAFLAVFALASSFGAIASAATFSKPFVDPSGCVISDENSILDEKSLWDILEDKEQSAKAEQVLCHLLRVKDKEATRVARHVRPSMSVAEALVLNTINVDDCRQEEFIRRTGLDHGCPNMARYTRTTNIKAGEFCQEYLTRVAEKIKFITDNILLN
jgi:hypothetical protein